MEATALPPSAQGQRTRARILSAATRLFAERGFAPVTIRAIADAAGIDNSSLYRHFESKSALARAAIDVAVADLVQELVQSARDIPPTLDGLVSAASATGMALWDRPATARLILHLALSWRDEPTGFRVAIPIGSSDSPAVTIFRDFAHAYAAAASAGEVRVAAFPEIFVALFSVLAVRPATRGSFLLSQEPNRTDVQAREAWRKESEILLRASLTP